MCIFTMYIVYVYHVYLLCTFTMCIYHVHKLHIYYVYTTHSESWLGSVVSPLFGGSRLSR